MSLFRHEKTLRIIPERAKKKGKNSARGERRKRKTEEADTEGKRKRMRRGKRKRGMQEALGSSAGGTRESAVKRAENSERRGIKPGQRKRDEEIKPAVSGNKDRAPGKYMNSEQRGNFSQRKRNESGGAPNSFPDILMKFLSEPRERFTQQAGVFFRRSQNRVSRMVS